MKLELINSLRIIIVAFLSYMPTVAFAGWFEAWVAKKMGDDIPEQAGFLTLNPWVHFSLTGFGILLFGLLFGQHLPVLPGWGRMVPISPGVLMGPDKDLRTVVEFIGRSIGHFILMFCGFVVALLMMNVMHAAIDSHIVFAQHSSFIESIRFVLMFFFQQNKLLFIIYFILGIFHSIVHFYFPGLQIFSAETMLWTMVILLAGIFIGAPLIELFLDNLFLLVQYMLIGV